MEYERGMSRQEVDSVLVGQRREWVARSPQHLQAHECAAFVLVKNSIASRNDRLGPDDSLQLNRGLEDADLAVGLVERAPRFTRVSFLGVAPRAKIFEDRDGQSWIPVAAFEEPRVVEPFKVCAPRDLTFLARLDLHEEARLALSQDGSSETPAQRRLRYYLLVFCFYDNADRYAAVRATVDDELAEHLDALRDLCFKDRIPLELGPEMTKMRDALQRETS